MRPHAQMDWWGLPDAVATAGKLFEYHLDRLTDEADDDDDDYGSAAGDQPPQLTLDVYQVSPDILPKRFDKFLDNITRENLIKLPDGS